MIEDISKRNAEMECGVDLTALPKRPHSDEQYFSYACSSCGKAANNCYSEPISVRMLADRHCFSCDYWQQFEKNSDPSRMTVIDGYTYTPGNRTSGPMRGMAGRRFDIEYFGNSVFSGQKTTTFDLWAGSEIPAHLREKFPDNAKFLGNAYQASEGGIKCWNASDNKSEPFPLPCKLVPASQMECGR